MQIVSLLESAGLRDKEARLYIALLKLGSANVSDVAKAAEVKRPTAYVLLEKLEELGYVVEVTRGHEKIYMAAKPEIILEKLDQRRNRFERALPELDQLVNEQGGRPQTKIFEGHDGILEAYEEFLAEAGEFLFITDIDNLFGEFGSLLENVNEQFRKQRRPFRELVGNTFLGRKYAREAQADKPFRQVRVLDREFFGEVDISNEMVLIVSYQKPNFFAVQIRNPQVAASQRVLFEQLWKSAKVIK